MPYGESGMACFLTSHCENMRNWQGGKSGTVLGSMKGSYDFVTGKVGHQTFQARVHEFFHILP